MNILAAVFEKENFLSFLIVSLVAVLVLIILLVLLHFHYKKRKLLAELNKENHIEVIEETPITSSEIDTLSSQYDNNEETIVEEEKETVVTEEHEIETVLPVVEDIVNPNVKETVSLVRYRKSFLSQLILQPNLQDIYKIVKDKFLSYKKVHSRLSFKNERFSLGRKTLARLQVRGKKLYLYLALDPETLEAKYHIQNVGDKKSTEEVPSLLKVLSPRSVKYALELIDKLMTLNEVIKLDESKIEAVDYEELLHERTFEQLLEEKLIVEYKVLEAVSEEEADAMVDEETLNDNIKVINEVREGRTDIVNIDTLSKNFKSNDVVNLQTLKRKKLVSKKASRVKLLARGTINKPLNVEADFISKGAMKMILAKGGTVTLIK